MPPPLRSRGLVTGREMLEEMRRRSGEEYRRKGASSTSGPNPPPLPGHGNLPPSVGLNSVSQVLKLTAHANITKRERKLNIKSAKGEGQLVKNSERGTGVKGIRRFLVQPKVEFLKDTQSEHNSARIPTEEGNGGSRS